ncbi:D-sedoheptulose 7-phosphate isomerase [Magnetospirillum moscoviense]|uniref:Phosphoheptose isomerase n=1 Tax=Magnetospirillum moscoviense TaxID=1437059 RepID=A0A178MWP2_9PROT|nr:D-sedoheptulose 7-phosphate isomerase [Magnetospirillum moscoviense]OAN55049.1 phosphoheptose isomerase [Magnetospirillum moscoviense]
MTPAQFLLAQMDEHAEVLAATRDAVAQPFERLVEACVKSLGAGGKILFFGNGGSAADAQHLAAEMVVRYRINRKALAAIALTTDTSTLTACANDYSFEGIFSRQVEALARPGDVLIGISTSGKSPNVVKALEVGKEMGCVAAGFAGGDGGVMKDLCDPLLVVPSKIVGRIQEMHILIGHALCDRVEVLAGGPGTQAH